MEVLLSVAILAIGAVLIMQALARGAYALAVAKYRSTAYAFSEAKLADLELSASQGLIPKASGHFGAGQERFEWTVSATPLEEALPIQRVTLTVGWRQGRHPYESDFSLVQRVPPESQP